MNKGLFGTNRHLIALLALLFAAGSIAGCSSKAKDDAEPVEKVIEKAEIEKMAEETGMSVQTLEAFQEGSMEMVKAEPDMAKARDLFISVLEDQPRFAEAHYNLGIVYSKMNQHGDAAEHFELAREIEPEVLDHTVALAQAYAVNEDYGRAAKLFEEVVARQPENLTAKNNLAVLSLRQGEVDVALGHVRDVLREDNQNVGALNTLGLVYSQRENSSLAKYVFEKAIRISYCEFSAEDENADAEAQVEEEVGAQKKPEGDASEPKKTCVERPDPDVHNNLGLVFMAEENVPAAVVQFGKAIEVDPNYLESRLNLGAVLIEYLDYERAGEQFSEAVRIAPENCVAHLGLGAASYGSGSFEEAAENYEFYVEECDAGHVSSYERLAKLNESQLADPASAIKYYNKLVELVEDETKVTNYKAMVNFLQSQLEADEPKEPSEPENGDDLGADGEQGEEMVGEEQGAEAPAEDQAGAEE